MKTCGRQEPHFRFADVEKLIHKEEKKIQIFVRGVHAVCGRIARTGAD